MPEVAVAGLVFSVNTVSSVKRTQCAVNRDLSTDFYLKGVIVPIPSLILKKKKKIVYWEKIKGQYLGRQHCPPVRKGVRPLSQPGPQAPAA